MITKKDVEEMALELSRSAADLSHEYGFDINDPDMNKSAKIGLHFATGTQSKFNLDEDVMDYAVDQARLCKGMMSAMVGSESAASSGTRTPNSTFLSRALSAGLS